MVCEGGSDRAIIEAVLDHYLDDYEPLAIQPPTTAIRGQAGPFGGGWKGVRVWCRQEYQIGRNSPNWDILIIQADTDVSADPEIAREKSCPPPADSANEVRQLILGWLGVTNVPAHTVLCVPAMASETWALVALFPNDPAVVSCMPPPSTGPCVECRTDIKQILRRLGRKFPRKLVVGQNGQYKNQSAGFRAKQLQIKEGWPNVIIVCGEAARFDVELRAVLPKRL